MATDFNPAAVAALPYCQTYTSEESLRWLMHSIAITLQTARNKIVQDGFNSIRSIVNMHSNDTSGFRKYLNSLNKTFAIATTRLRVYYAPVVIARFVAILYYYDQCVNSYHTIPDLSFVDSAFADEMVQALKEPEESIDNQSDDKEDIKVPGLQGTKNWVDFRNKFVL